MDKSFPVFLFYSGYAIARIAFQKFITGHCNFSYTIAILGVNNASSFSRIFWD